MSLSLRNKQENSTALFKRMRFLVYLEVFILAVLCALPFIINKRFKIHNPIQAISIIYFIAYGMPTIYMVNNLNLYSYAPHIKDDSLARSMLFIILFFISILLGYYICRFDKNFNNLINFISKSLPDINKYDFKFKNLPYVIILFEALGWASRLLIIKLGLYLHAELGFSALKISGFNLFWQYLYIFSTLPTIIFIIVFIKNLNGSKNQSLKLLTTILFIIELIYFFPTGSKEKILMPILFVLVILSVYKKLDIKMLLLAAFFFIVFIFPFTNIFKLIYNGRLLDNLFEAASIYFDGIFKNNSILTEETLFYILGQRLNYTEVVTNTIQNTPKIWDFKLGFTYLTFFSAFIPRFLWIDKPEPGRLSFEFANDYGYNQSYGDLTSVTMTRVGEAFINFGWFGAIVGFFLGVLYFFLYYYFLNRKKTSNLSILFYCYAFYTMINFESTLASDFSGLVKIYIIVLLFLFPFIKRVN